MANLNGKGIMERRNCSKIEYIILISFAKNRFSNRLAFIIGIDEIRESIEIKCWLF